MGFFITLLIYAALFVLAELLRPKPDLENAKPSDDVQAPTATENRPVPLLWGTVKIKGPNVIWYGDLRQRAITEKVKTGLFTSSTLVKGFQYDLGMQFGLARGGVGAELLRVFIGEDVAFDSMGSPVTHDTTFTINCPDLFGGDELGNGGIVGTLRFFEGNQTQTPSTYLSDFQQTVTNSRTPAYRGTMYLAPDVDPTYVGNSLQIKNWAFEVRRIPNGLGLSTAQAELNGGNDANPMNVLYEVLTNVEWGLKKPASEIDLTNFNSAAATLATEGNGFSYLHERVLEAADIIKLLEEQVDGVLFFNKRTGQWQINLARFDYNPATIPEIDETNGLEVRSFSRGSWSETSNIVVTEFKNRSDEYKETSALAQDGANVEIQQANVTSTKNYPGVKDPALANNIAWRDLRTLSIPLAKAKIVVDRTFWDVNVGEVKAFTDPDLGLTRLPMRIARVDLSKLEENEIVLDLIQDIFAFEEPSFADPVDTSWVPPIDVLVAFPTDEQVAFESPVGMTARGGGDVESDRIWCTARKQGPEVSFLMRQRNDPTTPSGAYADAGESFGFMLIGSLDSALPPGSAYPLTSLDLNASPDSQAAIEAAFTDGNTPEDLGVDLVNLIFIWDGTNDGEFVLVTSAQVSGADVQLNNVYRGVLDSAQGDWAINTDVYLLVNGGNLSSTVFPIGNVVDMLLLPRSISDELAEGSATAIQIDLDDRVRRPYPPSALRLGGTLWASTISLENAGSDGEDFAADSTIARRDFRTGRLARDEVLALDNDAANLFGDFPSANSTDHEVDVYDTTGAPSLLYTDTFSGTAYNVLRLDVLHNNGGALPTDLRLDIRARHTFQATQFDSRQDLSFEFAVTSALTGQFEFGDLNMAVSSATYTVDAAGVHNFTLSSSFAAGDVEIDVNGGGFVQLIAAGMTTGATGSLSVSDTIVIRHQSTDTTVTKHIDMAAPGAGTDAFGVLFT